MHVMLDDGRWHREIDNTISACDKVIDRFGHVWRRSREYNSSNGDYCTVCFTPREIALAKATAAVDREVSVEVSDDRMEQLRNGTWKRRAEPVPDAYHPTRKRTERISQRLQRELLLLTEDKRRPQVEMPPLQKPAPKDKP